jgi:hypothetical protein
MAEAVIGHEPDFQMGRVVNRTFGVIGRNLPAFGLLSVLAVAPQIAMGFLMPRVGFVTAGKAGVAAVFGTFLLSWLVSLIFSFLLQATLTYGTVMDLNGRRASIGECLVVALKVLLPLIAIGILFSLGIGFALILLIVPGLMLWTAWAVVVPVKVAEQKGIFESFGRSLELTRGHRWPIFGLYVMYLVAAVMVSFAVARLFGLALVPRPSDFHVGYQVVSGLLRAAIALIGATGAACIYYELRTAKEGVGSQQLASLFD